MKNPTAAALATAARNAVRDADKYAVQSNDLFPGAARVIRSDAPKSRNYSVWLPGALFGYPHGKCDCPFFEENGCCKHPLIAQADADYTAEVEARLEAMEAAIGEDDGKF